MQLYCNLEMFSCPTIAHPSHEDDPFLLYLFCAVCLLVVICLPLEGTESQDSMLELSSSTPGISSRSKKGL